MGNKRQELIGPEILKFSEHIMQILTKHSVSNISAFERVIDELASTKSSSKSKAMVDEFNELKNNLANDVWTQMHSPIKKHRSETRNEIISKKTKKNLAEFKKHMDLEHLSDKDVLTIATGLALSMFECDLITYQAAENYVNRNEDDIDFEEEETEDDELEHPTRVVESEPNQHELDEYELDSNRYDDDGDDYDVLYNNGSEIDVEE